MFWYILVCLAVISAVDIRKLIIPDSLVAALCAAGLGPWLEGGSFFSGFYFEAALLPLLVFGGTAAVCAALGREVPCGAGDAKLLAAIGLISGLEGLAAAYAAACLSAGAAAVLLLIFKKKKKTDRIPFGPFISLGFIVYLASASAMQPSSLIRLQV